ncbi:lyase family protein [Acidovorax sp. Leaf160]|uniref:lyase family protein n=1 Tax=Acidovorax sp. Leaf160 TaxID=1736280 RepID=UPI0007018B62|nr:lyase family protein [Acidovorax sp. Leaf160]KQR60323.1 3-carboxy-cis,cis-muconate cycloisomerase [Acidovorax sp. Leaf160]
MSIFEGFLSTPETLDAFGGRGIVAGMLRFEAALARAQAAEGLIPADAAQSIAASCKVDLFDVAKIVRDSARAGSIAIPLVRALTEAVGLFNPDAARHVHCGSSSQDVVDTALVLATRDALAWIDGDLVRAIRALLALAEAHAARPMLARTLMQPASVTSLGLKCVDWAAPLVRGRLRLHAAAGRALQLQLGGPVGTLAHMRGQGAAVRRRMAQELGLADPGGSWHTQRDEWVALGCELGVVTGSLGKLAGDLALLGQAEVGEVREPDEPGRGEATTMPHKRNPVASMVALAAAQRAPQRVAALLAAMVQQQERALGPLQAEIAEWPQLLMSTHGSARALATALPGLRVDAPRMRQNIDRVRDTLERAAADEWFDPALAEAAGVLARTQVQSLRALLEAA